MKKLLTFLLIIVGIAIVAVVTCPDRDEHLEKVQAEFNQALNEDAGGDYAALALASGIIESFGGDIIKLVFDLQFEVQDHIVYSTGVFHKDNGDKVVSYGFFGHVFTIDNKELYNIVTE